MKYAPFFTFVLLVCSTAPVFGWGFREHEILGRESYQRACAALAEELEKLSPEDPQILERFEIACGRDGGPDEDSFLNAALYGEACQFAGDHFVSPSEFTSDLAGRTAGSIGQFLGQAIQNRKHFHPDAVSTWMEYHEKALVLAETAARSKGLEVIQGFQSAFVHQAFGDHFLQDSFAAGHLGFNRAASSNAPARDMHNFWNRHGRLVIDRNGESWKTYGDGMLEVRDGGEMRKRWEKKTPEERKDWESVGRIHLEEASTTSVSSLLHAFIFGSREPNLETHVWRMVPVKAVMPTLGRPSLVEVLRTDPEERARRRNLPGNLREILRPAEVSQAVETWTVMDATNKRGQKANRAFMAGWTAEYPISYELWGGVKSFRLRIYAGFGRAGWDGKDATLVTDAGYIIPLFFSHDGLFSHEIVLGTTGTKYSATLHPDYRLNMELGKFYLRLQVGPSWQTRGEGESGFYASFGAGWVVSSRGGGARSH